MKKALFVVVLTVALLALTATAAFATIDKMRTGYRAFQDGDVSPHGGFTTTTQNCAVCHAVHVANNSGELLLQSTVADACTACHVSGYTGWVVVYDGDPALYSDAGWVGHDATNDAECTGCHQVHGADQAMVPDNSDTGNTYLRTKILAIDPLNPFTTPLNGADNEEQAVSKWCTTCHRDYYQTAYNGHNAGATFTSHVMKAADDLYANPAASDGAKAQKVALNPSSTCYDCHNAAEIDMASQISAPMSGIVTGGNFPHSSNTGAFRFLWSAGNNTNSVAAVTAAVGAGWTDTDGNVWETNYEDGVCLYCHAGIGAAKTGGVGMSF